MIKSDSHLERQKAECDGIRRTLEYVALDSHMPAHSRDAALDGLKGTLAKLESEILAYEDLGKGVVRLPIIRNVLDLGRILFGFRQAQGVSKETLASMLGVSMETINKLEDEDYSDASLSQIHQIERELGILVHITIKHHTLEVVQASDDASSAGSRRESPGPVDFIRDEMAMSPAEKSEIVSRIRRWAAKPGTKVHRMIGLMVNAGVTLQRDQFVKLIEETTGSKNAYGAAASLLTSAGGAYGRVLVDVRGSIHLHPDVRAEVLSHTWVSQGLGPLTAHDDDEEISEMQELPLGEARVPRLPADSEGQALWVAYYLSEFEHERLGLGDQGETFECFALRLGIKATTLRNHRDAFDPYTNSRRRGWWQKPLAPKLKTVFGLLKSVDEPTLRPIVLSFLR